MFNVNVNGVEFYNFIDSVQVITTKKESYIFNDLKEAYDFFIGDQMKKNINIAMFRFLRSGARCIV